MEATELVPTEATEVVLSETQTRALQWLDDVVEDWLKAMQACAEAEVPAPLIMAKMNTFLGHLSGLAE